MCQIQVVQIIPTVCYEVCSMSLLCASAKVNGTTIWSLFNGLPGGVGVDDDGVGVDDGVDNGVDNGVEI